MKIYNPFNPHIVECNNHFFIRKLTSYFQWEFLDKENNNHWWSFDDFVDKYCHFEKLEHAERRLENYKKALQKEKDQKAKYKKCKYVKS